MVGDDDALHEASLAPGQRDQGCGGDSAVELTVTVDGRFL